MAILRIGSTNPDLSFILSKNPATIRNSSEPFTRDLRKGKLYGWFSKADDSEFKLLFKDSDTEISFSKKNPEFEYMDQSRYSSPYIPIAIMNTALSSAMKQPHEKDTPEFESYVTTVIKISNPRAAENLVKHIDSVSISLEQITNRDVEVTVKGNSVLKVLNALTVFCLMQCLYDEFCFIDINSSSIEYFIRSINRIDAPYFVRYLVSRNLFLDKNTFQKYAPQLQLAGTIMNYGDTRRHRYDEVTKILTGGKHLVDIGCGELFFSRRMAKNYEMVTAFDADEAESESNQDRITSRKLDNIFAENVEVTAEFVKENKNVFDGADILLTEVIEHMEIDRAVELVKALLETDYKNIVVTVPNKDFNIHYGIAEEETRHFDHKWELSLQQIKELMDRQKILCEDVYGIGDSVNGTHATTLIKFKKD